jgi:hypothetical protein
MKPADEGTYKALKDMEVAGKVREEAAKWPTVLIYDVDRDVARESLPGRIVERHGREEVGESQKPGDACPYLLSSGTTAISTASVKSER